jgi:hypothetical protein
MGVLGARLDQAAAKLAALGKGELAAVNKVLTARKLDPVNLLTEEEWRKKGA